MWNLNLDEIKKVSYLKIVEKLNRLFKIDPELTNNMVNTRYKVSKEYEESEFICMNEGEAGLIGVLNGLLVDTDDYRIAASYNESDVLIGFCLMRFVDGKLVVV